MFSATGACGCVKSGGNRPRVGLARCRSFMRRESRLYALREYYYLSMCAVVANTVGAVPSFERNTRIFT